MCAWELILNKTGYSHIMEDKKKFVNFLTWELVENKLTPSFFPIFSGTRQFLKSKKRNSFRHQFVMFCWSNHCRGLTLPKVIGSGVPRVSGTGAKMGIGAPYPRRVGLASAEGDLPCYYRGGLGRSASRQRFLEYLGANGTHY